MWLPLLNSAVTAVTTSNHLECTGSPHTTITTDSRHMRDGEKQCDGENKMH